MMASLQPSGPETSNSSAHLRSGWVRVIRVDLGAIKALAIYKLER